MKACTKCAEVKPAAAFSKGRAACKLCCAVVHKAWRLANHAKVTAACKAWHEANSQYVLEQRIANRHRTAGRSKAWYAANSVQRNEKSKAWHEANPHAAIVASRTYRAKNREKIAAKEKIYRLANKERYAALSKTWALANPDKIRAQCAARRASKLKATAAWASKEGIAAVYAEAVRLTRETGVPHVVDHIVPLRSKLVSGLHVEHNLRAITALENASKGNRTWPDMPSVIQSLP